MNLEKQLTTLFARNWWVLLLRGLVAIAFGLLAWTQPGIALASLVLLFGAFTLADGILSVWAAIAGRHEHEHWILLLLGGLLSIAIGNLVFFSPALSALALLFVIAAWAIARGVLEIVTAIRIRKEIEGEWMLILSGMASVIFGFILMTQPEAGAIGLLWLIAFYSLLVGIAMVVLSFRLRDIGKKIPPAA
ncbi:MAG: HdeD family acid-resistance protein [Methylococcaceae bacterium]|jgi:uncharacterized membrane protein HdeD (DUF308 family)